MFLTLPLNVYFSCSPFLNLKFPNFSFVIDFVKNIVAAMIFYSISSNKHAQMFVE